MGQYDLIPDYTLEAIEDYLATGHERGGFIMAVMENNLSKAVAKADSNNGPALSQIVRWLWSNAPANAWGSPAEVRWFMEAKRKEETAGE